MDAELKDSSRKRLRPWLKVVTGLLLLLMVAVALSVFGAAYWLRYAMRDSLPVIDGTERLRGLQAAVTVRRDGHGVPHLEAASLEDLLMAQGYVTAQDRLWQMDMARRNAAGELSELLGAVHAGARQGAEAAADARDSGAHGRQSAGAGAALLRGVFARRERLYRRPSRASSGGIPRAGVQAYGRGGQRTRL